MAEVKNGVIETALLFHEFEKMELDMSLIPSNNVFSILKTTLFFTLVENNTWGEIPYLYNFCFNLLFRLYLQKFGIFPIIINNNKINRIVKQQQQYQQQQNQ